NAGLKVTSPIAANVSDAGTKSRRRANRMSEVIVCERMWPPCQRWIPFRDATHLFGMRTRTATRREAKERKGFPTRGALAPRVHEGRNAPVSRIGQQCGLHRSYGRLSFSNPRSRVNSRRPLEIISAVSSRKQISVRVVWREHDAWLRSKHCWQTTR